MKEKSFLTNLGRYEYFSRRPRELCKSKAALYPHSERPLIQRLLTLSFFLSIYIIQYVSKKCGS